MAQAVHYSIYHRPSIKTVYTYNTMQKYKKKNHKSTLTDA